MNKINISDWNTEEFFKTATVKSVERYLNAGANIHARNKYHKTTSLHYAAWWNENPEVIKILVKEGIDVNVQDGDGFTPLHLAAAWNKNPEIIKVLLALGAKIEARNKYGKTPLLCASFLSDNPEVVTVLLNAGADQNVKDNEGNSIWDYMLKNNDLKKRVQISYSYKK